MQALIGLVGPLFAVVHLLSFQVLLMLWNQHLPWAGEPYQFAELFAGVGNVSKEWPGPHFAACTCYATHVPSKETTWLQCGAL